MIILKQLIGTSSSVAAVVLSQTLLALDLLFNKLCCDCESVGLALFTLSDGNNAAVNVLKLTAALLLFWCCCAGAEKALDAPELLSEEEGEASVSFTNLM